MDYFIRQATGTLFKSFLFISLAVFLCSVLFPQIGTAGNSGCVKDAISLDHPFYLCGASSASGSGQCPTGVNPIGSIPTDLPATIPEPYRSIFAAAAAKFNVNPQYLAALFLSEHANQWLPATGPWDNSSVATGPFQFTAGTWSDYGVDGDGDGVADINNLTDAAFSAANLIGNGYHTDVNTPLGDIGQPFALNTFLRAAASYNWGSGNVASKTTPTSSITVAPQETQNYLNNVYTLITSGFTKSGYSKYPDPVPPSTPGDPSNPPTPQPCTQPPGGIATVDGFTFPLQTTQSIIKAGVDGVKWCLTSQDNCHHDYNAADIFSPTGTPVVAAKEGEVVSAKDVSDNPSTVGSRVTILGTDHQVYYYAHMGESTIKVTKGQQVTAGQQLGNVGTNENAMGTTHHLHFDMEPPPATSRVDCSGSECTRYTFLNVQPVLIKAFAELPE